MRFFVYLLARKAERSFKKCTGCHGVKGELKFPAKANPIASMAEDKRLLALEGYKEGNNNKYGMGSTMRSMVQNLSYDELKALNSYIESLKGC